MHAAPPWRFSLVCLHASTLSHAAWISALKNDLKLFQPLFIDKTYRQETEMAQQSLTIWVKDEGFYEKEYLVRPSQRLKALLREYRSRLCTECTDATLLQFWFEATQVRRLGSPVRPGSRPFTKCQQPKIGNHHTPTALGMADGDVIDVRIPHQHTRGPCPLSAEQTLPNIHYAVIDDDPEPPESLPASSQAQDQAIGEGSQSTPPKRFKVTVKDQKDFRLEFTLKADSRFAPVIEEFCRRAGREERLCRFLHYGIRVLADSTPAKVSLGCRGLKW